MQIGFIGTGRVAQTIAKAAVAHGHEVVLGSRRGPEGAADAVAELGAKARGGTVADAASARIVILAVPWTEIERALSQAPAWDGRILVDATNPFVAFEPELRLADLGGRSASRIVAEHAPGAKIVKAFNSITMATFDKGSRHGDARRVLFVSGDDVEAKTRVATLIEGLGYAVVDLGGLQEGGLLQQAGGPLAGKDLLLAD